MFRTNKANTATSGGRSVTTTGLASLIAVGMLAVGCGAGSADIEATQPIAEFASDAASGETGDFAESDPVAFAEADEPAGADGLSSEAVSDTNASASDPAIGETATAGETTSVEQATGETPNAVGPSLTVVEDSIGANGIFEATTIEVGEIWYTNQDPSQLLAEGAGAVGDDLVLVDVRLTTAFESFATYADYFRWLDAEGISTAPLIVLTSDGRDGGYDRIPENSSERRVIVFPAAVGTTAGAKLQIVDDGEPEKIPLGQGTATPAFPVSLVDGQTASSTAMDGSCEHEYTVEVREATTTLDRIIRRDSTYRVDVGQRQLRLTMVIHVAPSESNGCDYGTTFHSDDIGFRMKLDNGDVVAHGYVNERFPLDAPTPITWGFVIPADTTSMTLSDATGTELMTWTNLDLLPGY